MLTELSNIYEEAGDRLKQKQQLDVNMVKEQQGKAIREAAMLSLKKQVNLDENKNKRNHGRSSSTGHLIFEQHQPINFESIFYMSRTCKYDYSWIFPGFEVWCF